MTPRIEPVSRLEICPKRDRPEPMVSKTAITMNKLRILILTIESYLLNFLNEQAL